MYLFVPFANLQISRYARTNVKNIISYELLYWLELIIRSMLELCGVRFFLLEV